MESVAKQTNRDPNDLFKLPKINNAYLYLLDWFGELKTGERLTFAEMHAWSQLTGIRPNRLEQETLFRLDHTFNKTHHGN